MRLGAFLSVSDAMAQARLSFQEIDSSEVDSALFIVDALFEVGRAFSSTILLIAQLSNHCLLEIVKQESHQEKMYCQAYVWQRDTRAKQAVWLVFKPSSIEMDQTLVWSTPCLAHFVRLVRRSVRRAREVLVVVERMQGDASEALVNEHLALSKEEALELRTTIHITSLPSGTRLYVTSICRRLDEPTGVHHLLPSLRCQVASPGGSFPLDVDIANQTLRQLVDLQPLTWITLSHEENGETRISLSD